ncbi:MAG: hypothetical protein ACT6TH_13750 [Brevundimonas sp.]|jgi:hypothetical protein|nr:hypothetical protein JL11_15050 [Brevundimonas sp. DS20]MBU1538823.1 hypothetical protein [Alphaproteobacteria bacterium]OYX36641.1 MAG: hypothetical protein B7Y99_00785 [Caulobacterales bacterium 32-69-10]MBU2042870.1 hypothetical protein [Alphaproteobacteria bacterium]MBU2127233.1 hypothetical protein [Alphaproteobacteria bacterium]
MGHFLHRSECRSWIYPWRCPDCTSAIYVYQCSCGSGVFFETNQPPWPRHDCSAAIVGASMAGAGGWLKAGLDPSTGKGQPLEALKGFVAIGTGAPTPEPPAHIVAPAHQLVGVKAMDPMPGEHESFIGVVRDLKVDTTRIKELYADLGDLGRKLLDLPARGAARQITIEKNDLDPIESYTAVAPVDLLQGVGVGEMVWVELSARHGADRSAWVVVSLGALG